MSPSPRIAAPDLCIGARRLSWLFALFPALLAAFWLTPGVAQAGTITIVDGPNTPPTPGGVYTDGYIQAQLASANLTITTTGVITGPNEIRVLQGVTITWASGNQLTLDAGSSIVISGTIQHNGPANGNGGILLLITGSPTGTVTVGAGNQSAGVAVGSRFGLTRVQAGNLLLKGGTSGTTPYAQLGYHVVYQGAALNVSGPISVTVSQNVSATGGLKPYAYAQIGHGGNDGVISTTVAGAFSGAITVEAGGDVDFRAGKEPILVSNTNQAYAQLGHGGYAANGNHSGNHRLLAGGNVTFLAGSGASGYAQLGNGGYASDGNHSGNLTVRANGGVRFQGGTNFATYTQLGNGGYEANGNHSGSHTLHGSSDVVFQAGSDADRAYTQFGNGGFDADGNHSGNHQLTSFASVTFQAGDYFYEYAQFGNGGQAIFGSQSGSHTLDAGGAVYFHAGSEQSAYAQYGNGGGASFGSQSGNLTLRAEKEVIFQGNAMYAYAQMGNGGTGDFGNHTGNHILESGSGVTFQGGGSQFAYAQLGNGGYDTVGNHSGGHSLTAAGPVLFQGGGGISYAQFGNGGYASGGNHSSSHHLKTSGSVLFQAGGPFAYAMFGNGGYQFIGNQSGSHILEAGSNVSFLGGSQQHAYAQFGNGGDDVDGNHSGELTLTNAGNLRVAAGNGVDAYAMIGHGADVRVNTGNQGGGDRTGDIILRIGATAVFSGSQVGHLSEDGVPFVTQGLTYLGVSQNDPSFQTGSGEFQVIGASPSHFSSAPTANGGELRLYLPRADSQQVPTSAKFNGSSFATANTIPPARIRGFYPFGAGPYSAPYSFYLGVRADGALAKSAVPAGALNLGQRITYTLSFSNTGSFTATGVTIEDPLPSALTFSSATSELDAGVTITPTTGAPNLAWDISDLAPGKGGKLFVAATVKNFALVLGTTFTNTATISAADDTNPDNDSGSAARTVIPGATLVITKGVVGDAPAAAWQFSGSGDVGSFTLPAGGGNQSFTPLPPGAYTITETTKSGYTAAVSCTTGASGTNSVQVTLTSGATVGCTFVNTLNTLFGMLTVNKVVAGGPLTAADFALFVDGTPVTRGAANQLLAGPHTVSETSVPTYTASFGGACNAAGVVNLAAGTQVTCTITNTYTPSTTGSVTGLVYVDANGNNQPDPAEGLQGVTVTLQSETGVAAALTLTDTTDANGEYGFTNVPAGDYTLSFQPPAGYQSIDPAAVSVTAGQTTQAPTRTAVPVGLPDTLGDVFLPVLQR